MIAHVHGTVAEKFSNSVIVDVGGVGYEVSVALGDYETSLLGEPIKLYTYHHIREQSQELFGFSTLTAKRLFELLISVQGVGPKAGLAILSLADGETVRSAVASGDVVFICKATGVGKKTAERVIVDLRDKVGAPTVFMSTPTEYASAVSSSDEALEALMALGYNLNDATKALENVSSNLPTAERVTLALRG